MNRRTALGALIGGALTASEPPALRTASARHAFRAWFTWLAEALYVMPESARPREVSDCSALLRFAYREALRPHSAEWARDLGLSWMPPLPEIRELPPDAPLFRVASGESRHFADAEHLMRFNAWPLSRDVKLAQPGDLLFYRQLLESQSFHGMIFLGPSAFENSRAPVVVYHTGPIHNTRGEIRRPSLAELLAHPEPRWRPHAGNANFLGIFRWNILRDTN